MICQSENKLEAIGFFSSEDLTHELDQMGCENYVRPTSPPFGRTFTYHVGRSTGRYSDRFCPIAIKCGVPELIHSKDPWTLHSRGRANLVFFNSNSFLLLLVRHLLLLAWHLLLVTNPCF